MPRRRAGPARSEAERLISAGAAQSSFGPRGAARRVTEGGPRRGPRHAPCSRPHLPRPARRSRRGRLPGSHGARWRRAVLALGVFLRSPFAESVIHECRHGARSTRPQPNADRPITLLLQGADTVPVRTPQRSHKPESLLRDRDRISTPFRHRRDLPGFRPSPLRSQPTAPYQPTADRERTSLQRRPSLRTRLRPWQVLAASRTQERVPPAHPRIALRTRRNRSRSGRRLHSRRPRLPPSWEAAGETASPETAGIWLRASPTCLRA